MAGGIVCPWSPEVHTWQLHVFPFKLVARLEWPMTSEASDFPDWKARAPWCSAVEVDGSILRELSLLPAPAQLGGGITDLSSARVQRH